MSKYINLEKQLVRLYRLNLSNEEVIKQFLLTACVEDVQEVRYGKWIFNPRDGVEAMFTKPKCSLCGFESADGLNYCSNCGAKMIE